MPSGSRGGGGGGGHSFGGSGGSRSGVKFGTHRASYINRYDRYKRPHTYFFMGRRYAVGSYRYYKMSSIGTWILVLFVAILYLGLLFVRQGQTIQLVKDDHAYYANMIEHASDGQYMYADVINQFQGEGGKYYITYNMQVNNRDLWYEDGYTYSIYTMEEASEIFRSGQIEIVVDRLPLSVLTDSINADYLDYDITDDGTYINAVRTRTTVLIIGFIAIIGFGSLIFGYFKMMFKYQMNSNHQTNQSVYSSSTSNEYCIYCGSVMSIHSDKCPNCGASKSYSRENDLLNL